MHVDKRFSRRIKSARLKKGLSVRKVAWALDMSRSNLDNLENGRATASEDTIRTIARYYGEDVDEMMALAGKVPVDIQNILLSIPHSYSFLRYAYEHQWSLDVSQWREADPS